MFKLGPCAEAKVSLAASSPRLQKTKATYRTKTLSRQSLIGALIDIQLIGLIITATLINRGIGLAIIPRARMRTCIDNLDDDALPFPADRAARVSGTLVRDLVASAAVVFWTTGPRVWEQWCLPTARVVAYATGAETPGDVGRDVGCCGAEGVGTP